jgi:hypothetical protein
MTKKGSATMGSRYCRPRRTEALKTLSAPYQLREDALQSYSCDSQGTIWIYMVGIQRTRASQRFAE